MSYCGENASEPITNSTNSYEEASTYLWAVISPILFLIGLIGNITASLVLFKLCRQLKSTFHLFLLVLSLNDMVVLLSGLSRYWILNVFGKDVRDQSNVICKLQLYVIYTSMQFSAWILVSVTFHRFLIITKQVSKCTYTPKIAGLQLGIIFLILSAINFHYFFTNGICKGSCVSLSLSIFEFEEFVFVWIDLFCLCIIPFAIMLFSNIYFMINIEKCSATVNKADSAMNKKIKHSIRIIMNLTLLFLITNLPISIYFIVDSHTSDKTGLKNLFLTICCLLQYAGFSLNICFYVSVDPKFVSVLRPKARKLSSFLSSRTSFQLSRNTSRSAATTSNLATELEYIQTKASDSGLSVGNDSKEITAVS